MGPVEPTVEIVRQLPSLSARRADSHKGDFGRVLVVAGSRGMAGAAILSGSAALRGGAGIVRLAVPHEILPTVAAGNPCYMTVPLPGDDHGRLGDAARDGLLELAQAHDVIAVGPGLNRSPVLTALLAVLLAQVSKPVVLDADGLNAFADHPERLRQRTAPLILTPHPGELARLVHLEIAEVQAKRRELAVGFARAHNVVVVLKGHGTLVTDGHYLYENNTGNPGMATPGSGDVLTGLVAALLGQGLAPFAAAQLGVYLHGLSGDLARADLGEVSLIATDLIAYLPKAFVKHLG